MFLHMKQLFLFVSSQLVASDSNFQAVYHAGVMQVLLFSLIIFVWDSYSAKRYYHAMTEWLYWHIRPYFQWWWIHFDCRVHLDLTNLYTSFHHLCLFLLLEVYLLTLTFFIHPCFKVGVRLQLSLDLSVHVHVCIHVLYLQLWQFLYERSSASISGGVNLFFIILYAAYVLGTAAVVCWAIYTYSFPTFPTIAASVEQVHVHVQCTPFSIFLQAC